jgi:hypothetical protein
VGERESKVERRMSDFWEIEAWERERMRWVDYFNYFFKKEQKITTVC